MVRRPQCGDPLQRLVERSRYAAAAPRLNSLRYFLHALTPECDDWRNYHEHSTEKTLPIPVPTPCNALHHQGKAKTTIDVYSRSVRRITEFFDQCPEHLSEQQLKDYFTELVRTHSWSTVKVDRNGLQ
ncbi:phage integrase N-terminal SAM-like domain-containing protein [Porticoccus sp. GXU_MW_L64]